MWKTGVHRTDWVVETLLEDLPISTQTPPTREGCPTAVRTREMTSAGDRAAMDEAFREEVGHGAAADTWATTDGRGREVRSEIGGRRREVVVRIGTGGRGAGVRIEREGHGRGVEFKSVTVG